MGAPMFPGCPNARAIRVARVVNGCPARFITILN